MNQAALANISRNIQLNPSYGFNPMGWNFGLRKPTADNLSAYITKIQFQRLSADLKDLGDGISEAEYAYFPQRIKLMRIFIDVVDNPFIKPLLDRAKELTLQRDLYIYQIKNGKRVKSDVLSQNIQNQHWFQDYLEYILDAIYWGYTLIELGDIDTNKDNPFPDMTFTRRENLRPDGVDTNREQSRSYNGNGDKSGLVRGSKNYDNIERGFLKDFNVDTKNYNGKSGAVLVSIPYMIDGIRVQHSDDPLVTMCNHWIPTKSTRGVSPCGYGLLTQISHLAINITHVLEWWMDYIEVYGQPLRVGKTRKQGDKRKIFERNLENMGSNPWMLLDEASGDDIKFENSSGQGTAWKSYQTAIREYVAGASQLILGHADAIISMPGKLGGAQAANKDGFNESLIEQAMNSKQISYGNFTCRKVNEISAPLFRKLGNYIGSKTIGDLIPEGYYMGLLNDKEEQEIIRRTNATMERTSVFMKNQYDAGWQLKDPQVLNDWAMKLGFPSEWIKVEPRKELDEKRESETTIKRENGSSGSESNPSEGGKGKPSDTKTNVLGK